MKEKIEEIQSRTKRQAGELKKEAEGALEQAKGKTQQAFGKMKDAGREALDRAKMHSQEQGKPYQNVRPKKPAA
jgi:uncharacterized protein YjbJ (UPF0337 family)